MGVCCAASAKPLTALAGRLRSKKSLQSRPEATCFRTARQTYTRHHEYKQCVPFRAPGGSIGLRSFRVEQGVPEQPTRHQKPTGKAENLNDAEVRRRWRIQSQVTPESGSDALRNLGRVRGGQSTGGRHVENERSSLRSPFPLQRADALAL